MKPTISSNKRDVLNLQEKLAMLALPPKKRIWILKTLGRWEKTNTRKRIQQQKDIHGKALQPKKREEARQSYATNGERVNPLCTKRRHARPYLEQQAHRKNCR